MDITPPYGYQEVVPLTKEHRVVLPAENKLPPVFRGMMVIPLSYTEFSLACHDYPVVFVSGDQGKTAVAMAVVGLEQQQNLFVAPDLTWDRNAYVPAYVRRYPFCMTRVNVSGQEQAERIGGHVAERVRHRRNWLLAQRSHHHGTDVDRLTVELGGQTAVAIVESDDEEPALGELAAEAFVPHRHLGGEPHDEQEGRMLGVTEGVVLEFDTGLDNRSGHCRRLPSFP